VIVDEQPRVARAQCRLGTDLALGLFKLCLPENGSELRPEAGSADAERANPSPSLVIVRETDDPAIAG
jgi:hypothetical protein